MSNYICVVVEVGLNTESIDSPYFREVHFISIAL